jgi:hypothetical protein
MFLMLRKSVPLLVRVATFVTVEVTRVGPKESGSGPSDATGATAVPEIGRLS